MFIRMFLYDEKKFLESQYHEDDAEDFFPEFIVKFLKDNNRLHTIQNRVCYDV